MTGGSEGALPRLAVLIDGDNARAATVEALLAEIAKLGIASVKRIYGDWTRPDLASWKDVLLRHAVQPVQQFGYTTGKNATDCALIIDAMDLLYTRRFSGFCIVSSDSDFTRLAARLREEGVTVYGFGERKTPQSFVSACDKFIYTEILSPKAEASKIATPKVVAPKVVAPAAQKKAENNKATTNHLKGNTKLVMQLRGAAEAVAEEDGWAKLEKVTKIITSQSSDFDPRNFGYKKLHDLITATELFAIEERSSDGGPWEVYIRDKKRK